MNPDEKSAIVVGSGPAGVAVTIGLLSRGYKVRMVDAGLNISGDAKQLSDRMSLERRENWSTKDLEQLTNAGMVNESGIPLKLIFGSDFPYQDPTENVKLNSTDLLPSYAFGGLSNVWGASVLPYNQKDLDQRWPITSDDLREHYIAVADLFELVGAKDDLESEFPLFASKLQALEQTPQIEFLDGQYRKNKAELNKIGLISGVGRLAFHRSGAEKTPCILCGNCLYGCPRNIIFNSKFIVRDLLNNSKFSYTSGLEVRQFAEKDGVVQIHLKHLETDELSELTSDKLFLAAGVLNSATIVFRSQGREVDSVELLDSQYFLFPLILRKLKIFSPLKNFYTLSQRFLEIRNQGISSKSVHVQLYGYNPLFAEALKNKFGMFGKILGFLIKPLSRSIVIAQGYMHSDESSKLTISWNGSQVEIIQKVNEEVSSRVKGVVAFLKNQGKLMGFFCLRSQLQIANPGRGFHSGGSFPMTHTPQKNQTDKLGRLFGYSNVHIVDASILPSIPANTITFTVMANAHRIGADLEI